MKFLDLIKEKINNYIRKRNDKKVERFLVKKGTDEDALNALPADEDNSGVRIKKVLESMDNQENMAELIESNIDEIIEQDDVKNTLINLEPETVREIFEEHKEEFVDSGKAINVVKALDEPVEELNLIEEHTDAFTNIEVAEIMSQVSEESKDNDNSELVEKKSIKIISKFMLEHIIQYGYVSQVDVERLIRTLKSENSKLSVAKLCLETMNSYEKNKNKVLSSSTKVKLIHDILKLTQLKEKRKKKFLTDSITSEILTEDEAKQIEERINIDKLRETEKLETIRRGRNR